MVWSVVSLQDLHWDVLKNMYDMYVTTYTSAGQPLWFNSPQQLMRYQCVALMSDTNEFILYSKLTHANKISLFAHDGTTEGREEVVTKLVELLNTPGYIIEAS